jgi:hypothetical protein
VASRLLLEPERRPVAIRRELRAHDRARGAVHAREDVPDVSALSALVRFSGRVLVAIMKFVRVVRIDSLVLLRGQLSPGRNAGEALVAVVVGAGSIDVQDPGLSVRDRGPCVPEDGTVPMVVEVDDDGPLRVLARGAGERGSFTPSPMLPGEQPGRRVKPMAVTASMTRMIRTYLIGRVP